MSCTSDLPEKCAPKSSLTNSTPADCILGHLATYSRVWSPLSDVVLVCRDGLLPAHKLVLAALSPLLRSALAEADTWDQENKLSVLMPDFSMLQMSQYFADLWKCSDMKQHSDINFVFGHLSLSSLKTYSVQEESIEHSHNLVSDVVVEDESFDPANIKVEAIEVSDSVDTETKGSEITSALDYTWVACEVCWKNFPSNGARNKHLAIHREGKHFCKFCGKRFNDVSNKNSHEKHVHGSSKFICSECGKAFKSNRSLCHHFAKAHSFDAEPPPSKKKEVTRDRADVVFWGPQEEAGNSKMVEVVVDPLEVETILGSN